MNNFLGGLLAGLLAAIALLAMAEEEHEELEYDVKEYCFEPYGTEVRPERMSTKFKGTVNWYHDGPRGGNVYASWDIEDDGTVDCELWLIMPRQIMGDPDMDGIGHEFLHCVAGDFHPEDN